MMALRDSAISVLRVLPGVEPVTRRIYRRFVKPPPPDTLTSCMEKHFSWRWSVNFMQIGSCDGIVGDPLYPLVLKNKRWKGVLIEPQPEEFQRLMTNYREHQSRLQFLNVAISNTSGERNLYQIPKADQHRVGVWSGQVASFEKKHVLSHFPNAPIKTLKTRTMTFAEVAKLLPDSRVDLLVIDVEGHERAILESIDFSRHRVRFVLYEHKHMVERQSKVVESLLLSHSFRLRQFEYDTIAWRYTI